MQDRHAPRLRLDHLAVTAPDLTAGLAHVRAALGLEMSAGGAHPQMGTHNYLLALGPSSYLEVIAIDPAAPAPTRPRWFALDAGPPAPRLATWIARVGDLDAAIAAAPIDTGRAIPMSRGDLSWRIAIRDDGSLPMGGAFPTLIEWPAATRHPARAMTDHGARLTRLLIETPEAATLGAWLAAHLEGDGVEVRAAPAPRLRAEIETPAGRRHLA